MTKVIEFDKEARAAKQEADGLRAERNTISKQIGALMAQGKKEEAEEAKKKVTEKSEHLASLGRERDKASGRDKRKGCLLFLIL